MRPDNSDAWIKKALSSYDYLFFSEVNNEQHMFNRDMVYHI